MGLHGLVNLKMCNDSKAACTTKLLLSPVVTLASCVVLYELLDLALGRKAFASLYPTM